MIDLTLKDKVKIIMVAVIIIGIMAVVAILASCNFFETWSLDCEKAVGCIFKKPGC